MATSYKALMALGDSHTKSVERTVQAALAAKKAKDAQRRKAQEEQERKEHELQAKLRLQYFAEQKRAQEAKLKAAEEREKQEADLLRREAAQRDALRYGPKKAASKAASSSKYPTSGSGVREEVRKKRFPEDEDDEPADTGSILTREEKRERKLQAELKRAFHSPRKATHATGGTRKAGRRLPGGAYDLATTPEDALAAKSGQGNVKERLAAMPNTLTRLNVVKRDTRTIDEIVRDRREGKDVLDGDRARGFDDWFTPATKKTAPSSSAPSSRPSSQPTSSLPTSSRQHAAAPTPTPASKARPKAPPPPPPAAASSSKKRPRSLSLSRSASPPPHPKRPHVASSMLKSTSASTKSGTSSTKGKSLSRSRSPRARAAGPSGGAAAAALSDEIWSLFGKNKQTYLARDVLSDSEDDGDMEAGASAVEAEEKRSERIALREEREAEAEERRHEEEKRRRKAAAMGR
ncbi:hypothetical protein B0H11DRAFT_2152589 [Mycena galericulata]|nr:hypothetical protein B0H11DRAFT_2152589 [Mycena galericulata]